MDLIRSLPNWRDHVKEAMVKVKRVKKKGPRPQGTRIKKRKRKEKMLMDQMEKERRRIAKEELGDCPTPQLEDAVEQLENSMVVCPPICSLVLQECGNEKAISWGKKVHRHVLKLGYDQDRFLGNQLVQMYGKCERVDLAYEAFMGIRRRNTYSWTILVRAYIEQGHLETAKCIFDLTPKPNSVSWNTMIAGYAQNGEMETAKYMFDWMKKKTVVSWTTMIKAYVGIRQERRAIQLFKLMDLEGVVADRMAVVKALDACASLGDLAEGKAILASADFHLLSGLLVGNCSLNMYSKCGSLADAMRVFERMSERDMVLWASLIEAYARNGYLQEAKAMFDEIPQRDVSSWTAMITAYTQAGYPEEALNLVPAMDMDGVVPNWRTFISILDACGAEEALDQGRIFHANIADEGLESCLDIANSLLDMYAKCGSLGSCDRLFNRMPRHSVTSWATLIAANAENKHERSAKMLFMQMLLTGVEPDEATFDGLLVACTEECLVENACIYFKAMVQDYGVQPNLHNYVGLINVLGHAGYTDTAEQLVNEMPFEPDVVAWTTLLSACQMYGDVQRGRQALQRVHELKQAFKAEAGA